MKKVLILVCLLQIVACSEETKSRRASWFGDFNLDGVAYQTSGSIRNDSSEFHDFKTSSNFVTAQWVGEVVSINFSSQAKNSMDRITGTLSVKNPILGKQMAFFYLTKPYPIGSKIEVNIKNLGTPTEDVPGILKYGDELKLEIPKLNFTDSLTGIPRELKGSIKAVRLN